MSACIVLLCRIQEIELEMSRTQKNKVGVPAVGQAEAVMAADVLTITGGWRL